MVKRIWVGFPLLVVAVSAGATMIIPRTLTELAAESELIFHGTCVKKEAIDWVAEGQKIPAVEYTFAVEEWFKGNEGKEFLFRQFREEPGRGRMLRRHEETPIDIGTEAVLFLRPLTRFGFRGIANIRQGFFRVDRDAQGERRVRGERFEAFTLPLREKRPWPQ